MPDAGERIPLGALAAACVAGVFCCIPALVPPWAALAVAALFTAATGVLWLQRRNTLALGSQESSLLLLLLVFVPLGIIASPLPALSIHSASVFVWSVGAMFAAELWLESDPQVRIPSLLSGVAIAFGILALLTMEAMPKFPFASDLNAALPHLGGFAGIPQGGLPANELAGVAAWLLPVLTVFLLGDDDKPARTTWLAAIAVALIAIVLIAAQSRGAAIAAGAGLFVAFLLSGKRARIALGVLLVLMIAGIAVAGIDTLTSVFTYHRRADSVLPIFSGRDDIWMRGWMLVADIPLCGIGFGSFGQIVGQVYPFPYGAATTFEDAHNLFLQTALDMGVAGLALLLVFFGGIASLLVRERRQRPSGLASGLLGFIIAYLLYNVTDAVALFSPASVVAFLLFAAARTLPRPGRPARGFAPLAVTSGIAAAAMLLAVLVRPGNEQWQLCHTLASTAGRHTESRAALLAQTEAPRVLWYNGLLDRKYHDTPLLIDRWSALAATDPEYVPYMAAAEPLNLPLAQAVYRADSATAGAAFWLAGALLRKNPGAAVPLYRKALVQHASDGRAWLGLGDALLASGDTTAAHEAFARACFHDDPGLNGCWRAALTAEALGDTIEALKYYDISNYIEATKRAAALRAAKRATE